MKEFIINNYQQIILIFACLFDVVLFLIGVFKKKANAPLTEVISCLPRLIIKAEKKIGAGNGSQKKLMVLDWALDLYKELTGVDVDCKSWIAEDISVAIERILRTPQKKEEK